MRINVNGEARDITALNLAAALIELGWAEAHVATAVNGKFVATTARPRMSLAPGDRVEVLTAMQGG